MHAEIISIGDELTSGQRLDTNSQWLSERLGELGVPVRYHTTVADDLEANVGVFRHAVSRAEIVVSTGGLGPTADDLTREALAAMLGVRLQLDQPSLDHIVALFAHRKRPMPETNIVQAMFPEGSRVIPNPHGTAPGIDLAVSPPLGRPSRVFALPGVPAEMKEMWHTSVVPRLVDEGAGREVIRHRRIKCFGVGESDLEQMLPDIIRRGRVPSVGITVSDATITLRITASGRTPEDCFASMAATELTIHECLGTLVFGYEDDEIPDTVVRLLRDRGKTLATVEWGTSGLMAQWLGEVPGSEAVFRAGLVVRDADSLSAILRLPADTMQEHAASSGELASAMASAARELSGADYGLAIGKFPNEVLERASVRGAGLPPASEMQAGRPHQIDAPHYFFALASAGERVTRSSPFAAHPAVLKPRAAKQALNLLRLQILKQP